MARLETLLVSTRNAGKLVELRELLAPLSIQLTSADDVSLPEVDETGTTLVDNALLKAAAGYLATGLPTLADDSGLCVDALDGAPGVYSARFAGENVTYEDNWRLLLTKLEGLPRAERGAAFVCCLALVLDEGLVPADHPLRVDRDDVPDGATLLAVEGRVEGWITTKPAGDGGFGYDPVFYYDPAEATFAQMSSEAKNAISHRGEAYHRLADVLAAL